MNPITLYLSQYPFSKTQLAEHAGISYQTVNKAELGLYSSIPHKLANFMAANPYGDAEHPVGIWNSLYLEHIADEMQYTKALIRKGTIEALALFVAPENLLKDYGSFTGWRESLSYSQMDFCKTFMLHQGIISKYESGQMKNLPVSLRQRLTFLGMTPAYLKALEALPTA